MTDDCAPLLLPLTEQPGRARVYCRLCHAELTDAESRRQRAGRTCRHKLGLDDPAPLPRGFTVDQDPLPGT